MEEQFLSMLVVDRVGRRRLILIFFPIMMSGLVWCAISAWYLTASTGHFLVDGVDYDHRLAGILVGGIVVFVVGYGSCCSLGWYQSEYLALEIRATGSAIATTCLWLANLVVSVSYLTQLETITPTGTFCLYLGFSVCGFIFLYLCYPESSKLCDFSPPVFHENFQANSRLWAHVEGISVDEIARLFEDDFGVAVSRNIRAEKEAALKRNHDIEMAEMTSPSAITGTDRSRA